MIGEEEEERVPASKTQRRGGGDDDEGGASANGTAEKQWWETEAGERGADEDDFNSDDDDDGDDDDDDEAGRMEADDDGDGGGCGGPVVVMPLYAMLPAKEQMRVFAPPPPGARLIIVATNVAETSITIPGIRYVVDAGKTKMRRYQEGYAVSKFELEWTSQASANQRAGRAGRLGPGHCYRLYSSAVFTNFLPPFAEPEICRVPVEGVVLAMKAMGIARVSGFPFPEPPPTDALQAAQTTLRALGAVDGTKDARATPLGMLLAKLPIDARLGKLLLVCRQAGLLRFGLPLVCMLAQPDPYERPDEGDGEGDDEGGEGGEGGGGGGEVGGRGQSGGGRGANGGSSNGHSHGAGGQDDNGDGDDNGAAAKRWRCPESEPLDVLGLYLQWRAHPLFGGGGGGGGGRAGRGRRGANGGGGADMDAAAAACGLSPKVMREAAQLHSQLGELLSQLFPAEATPPPPDATTVPPTPTEAAALRRALCFALPDRIARLSSLATSPEEVQLISDLGTELRPVLLRRSFVGSDTATARTLLWLRPHSELARLKPKAQYVAFFDVIRSEKRPYLGRPTLIDPSWLPDAAPPLTRLSPPLQDMPPRYDAATDAAQCFVRPTYGAARWLLPPVPRAPPASTADLPSLRASLFARALCDGQVLKGLRPFAELFSVRLRALASATPDADRAAAALRNLLAARSVVSRRSLAAAWGSEPRFLLRELSALLPPQKRQALLAAWPKLLVQAERAERGGGAQ